MEAGVQSGGKYNEWISLKKELIYLKQTIARYSHVHVYGWQF